MLPVGFELRISAGERPQTYALDRAATGTGNRNEYQEYFLGVKDGLCTGLTTLPPSCDDCHEIWGLKLSEPPVPVQAHTGITLLFTAHNNLGH
jgi:hypothetical protein